MGLFGGGNPFGRNQISGDWLRTLKKSNEPTMLEKVDMLFKDVETDGKKQGYARAAHQYSKVFNQLEEEYLATKQLIEQQIANYDALSNSLIDKLDSLEKQKSELRQQANRKINDVSKKYNVSIFDVTKSLSTGSLFSGGPAGVDILGIIYNHKEKKLKEAEQRGYVEAKQLYEKKIAKLKSDLLELKNKGSNEVQQLLAIINELFDAIADEQMKIAELQLLL